MSQEHIDRTAVLIRVRPIPTTRTVEHTNSIVIDQNTEQQFKAIAIRRLIWKLDRRLIPLLVLLIISAFVDQANIGHIKLMGIGIDLNMSQTGQDWFISIFSCAALIFGIPSNILLRLIGSTYYLSLSTITWGSLIIGMAFVKTTRDLLIIRFFLAMSIAGFYLSMIIYFSLWYCKRQQIMRLTILHTATIIACIFSSLLAHGTMYLEGVLGLNSWQWLYLLEGFPDILIGVLIYFFLDTILDTVQWLDNCEKELLTNFLRVDMGVVPNEFISGMRFSWQQVSRAFTDWRIYLYTAIGTCNIGLIRFLTTYIPLLVQDTIHSGRFVHFIVGSIYGITSIFCLLVGYSSSCRKEISFHLIFCQLISLVGFVLMLVLIDRGPVTLFISVCILCCGVYGTSPLIISWVTNNIAGHTKRTIALGLVLSVVQCPGIIAPQVYPDGDRPIYRRGHFICIGFLVVSFILTLTLRSFLMRENRRRENLSDDEYNREAAVEESCDLHPDIRYLV